MFNFFQKKWNKVLALVICATLCIAAYNPLSKILLSSLESGGASIGMSLFYNGVSWIPSPNIIFDTHGNITAATFMGNVINVVNVVQFGADTNGIIDCGNAIQTALNTAGLGGLIYFPKGTYYSTNSICFNQESDMIILGQSGLNSVIITGGTTGQAQWDMIGCQRMIVENFSFQSSPGVTPSCAILFGRKTTSVSSGLNTFENVNIYNGNYGISCIFGIASEQNHFKDCLFNQPNTDTNIRTLVYLSSSANNIYMPLITSRYYTITTTMGDNGANQFEHCLFVNNSFSNNSSAIVLDNSDDTYFDGGCFGAMFWATNFMVITNGSTIIKWDGAMECDQPLVSTVNGFAFYGISTNCNLQIHGITGPIWGDAGALLDTVKADGQLVGTYGTNMLNVDMIQHSFFNFSQQLNQYLSNITNYTCTCRSWEKDTTFGIPSTNVYVNGVAGTITSVIHFEPQMFLEPVTNLSSQSNPAESLTGQSNGVYKIIGTNELFFRKQWIFVDVGIVQHTLVYFTFWLTNTGSLEMNVNISIQDIVTNTNYCHGEWKGYITGIAGGTPNVYGFYANPAISLIFGSSNVITMPFYYQQPNYLGFYTDSILGTHTNLYTIEGYAKFLGTNTIATSNYPVVIP